MPSSHIGYYLIILIFDKSIISFVKKQYNFYPLSVKKVLHRQPITTNHVCDFKGGSDERQMFLLVTVVINRHCKISLFSLIRENHKKLYKIYMSCTNYSIAET